METVEIAGKRYTQVGTSRYKQIEWSGALPPCQADLISVAVPVPCTKLGEFDSPTPYGPWADLCTDHVEGIGSKNSTMGYHRIISPRVEQER